MLALNGKINSMSAKLGEGMWVKATQEVYNIPPGMGLNKEPNVSKPKVFFFFLFPLNCDLKIRADKSLHLTVAAFISTLFVCCVKNTVITGSLFTIAHYISHHAKKKNSAWI